MCPEQWILARELFHLVLDIPQCERSAFLKARCGDGEVLAEIEALLAAAEGAPEFLQPPAIDGARDALQEAVSAAKVSLGPLPSVSLREGDFLGPYRITGSIAAGGMGQVYAALDTRLSRKVAVKVLPPAFAQDPERMARFAQESNILAALNHPNVVAIYDVGENFIVTELVPGKSLRNAHLPLRKTLDIIAQCAEGLAAAHEAGIVHRDIKPDNLLLTPDGYVKLVDFGVAMQDTHADFVGGEAGMLVGTTSYMSPEQIRGDRVDRRSDIFSLGLVLFELLVGRRCFEAGSPIESMRAILQEPVPDLPQTIPIPVQQLLVRCLEKNPPRRFQSAADLAFSIRTILSTGVPGGMPVPGGPHRQWMRKGLLIAGIVGLAVGEISLLARRQVPPAGPVIRVVADIPGAADVGDQNTPAISQDGTKIVFSAIGPDARQQLMIRRLDQTSPVPIPGTSGGYAPFFSPRGDWIGFFTPDGFLKKVSMQGDSVVTVCEASSSRGASWSESGDIIAALGPTSALVRIPAGGGAPKAITTLRSPEVTHRWPQVLPGGKAVLFTAHSTTTSFEDATINILLLKDLTVKQIVKGGYFGRYLADGNLVFAHKGKLLGARFDVRRSELLGSPQSLLDDLAGDSGLGNGRFDSSSTGVFLYQSAAAKVPRRLAWLTESGRLEPLLVAPGSYFTPRVSPDGRRVIVQVAEGGARNLQILDLQSGSITPLTFTPKEQYSYPVWAPDGKHVAFAYTFESTFGIGWLSTDGATPMQNLFESSNFVVPGSFTPDGRALAYSELTTEAGYNVWILPLQSAFGEHLQVGKPFSVLDSKADEYSPVFSPDGRWLAYESNESGTTRVYVCDYPLRRRKWLASSGQGRFPIWSRKKRTIFYENNETRIMAVDYVVDGHAFVAKRPRLWTGERIAQGVLQAHAPWNYDLSPDGKRFVILPEDQFDGAHPLRVTFLLNFFDGFRRAIHR